MGDVDLDGQGSPVVLAPLWRRCAASIVEASGVLGAIAGLAALVMATVLLLYRDPHIEKRLDDWLSKSRGSAEERRARRRRVRPESLGSGLAYAIQSRNRQSYGQKLLRIRRVGVSAQPVTSESAAMHYVVSTGMSELVNRAMYRASDNRRERMASLKPELAKLRRDHDDDPIRFLREFVKLGREHNADPFTPLVIESACRLAVHVLCVLASPKRQSPADLAAGIITMADTGSNGR